jgi:hypothetical protein
MSLLHTLGAGLLCGVLCFLVEICGDLLLRIVLLPFAPVHWAIVSVLCGDSRRAWLRALVATALAAAALGSLLIATVPTPPWPAAGITLVGTSVLFLLELERASRQAKAERVRLGLGA